MGACASSEGAKQTKAFDAENRNDYEREQEKVKLLFLGAGQSGKSTFFKQMKIKFGSGLGGEEFEEAKALVYSNLITAMQNLVENARGIENMEALEQFREYDDFSPIDERLGTAIQGLWQDASVQEAYARRAEYQLIDSASYYFSRLEAIMQPDYLPSEQDVLRTRCRTSGLIIENFNISEVEFVVYDVGGQRNERKKWIYCFDNVTAVLFLVAISAYDQVLIEDFSVNRLEEALQLYDNIANGDFFASKPIMLFLNKKDLFEQKIKIVDIRAEATADRPARFLDYEDGICECGGGHPNDYACTCSVQEKAIGYIRNKFTEIRDTDVYVHVTTATNKANAQRVLNAVQEIVLKIVLLNE